jgi:hypothetical protein
VAEAFPHAEVVGFDLIRNSTLYVFNCSAATSSVHDKVSPALSHPTVGKNFSLPLLTPILMSSDLSLVVGDMTRGDLSPYQSSCDIVHCRSVIGHVSLY